MDRAIDVVIVEFDRQESEAEAMKNSMTNTHLFARTAVVPTVGFAGSFALAEEGLYWQLVSVMKKHFRPLCRLEASSKVISPHHIKDSDK